MFIGGRGLLVSHKKPVIAQCCESLEVVVLFEAADEARGLVARGMPFEPRPAFVACEFEAQCSSVGTLDG
jgi:hypothetical protein